MEIFPGYTMDNFTTAGYFFTGYGIHKILGSSKPSGVHQSLRGFGDEFHLSNNSKYFGIIEFDENYLKEFKFFLNSLKDREGEIFFQDFQVERILEKEKIADSKRNQNEKPYVRHLIWSWLAKAGVYITDYKYLGYFSNENKTIFGFYVKEFLRREEKKYLFSINKGYQGVNFFDNNFSSEIHLDTLEFSKIENSINFLYTEKNSIFKLYFERALSYFYSELNDKPYEATKNKINIYTSALEKAEEIRKNENKHSSF